MYDMNTKSLWSRFWSNPYKWGLWNWIGGRPWTYILRDIWHKCEFVWIIGLIAIGVFLGHHFDWIIVLEILGIFTIGFVSGHLFWGKDYIPDQGGNNQLPPTQFGIDYDWEKSPEQFIPYKEGSNARE